jgi:EmrB/QacA subfamily drug resistance transporter
MPRVRIHHPALRRRRLDSLALSHQERTWTLIALILATATAYWSDAASFLILGDISGSIGASFDETTWLITTYATAYAVGVALSHRLTSYFGNRRLLFFSCLTFAAGSLGEACSVNLPMFLVFRVITGVAGGAFLARTLVFLMHRYDKPQRAVPLRNFSICFLTIGRVVGPIASGWFTDTISWRMAFAATIPLSLIAAYLFHTYAAEHWIDEVEDHRPDLLGIGLLIAGIASLQIMLDRGEVNGWFESPEICILAVLAILTNGLFILWQFLPQNKHPLINAYHVFDRGMFAGMVLALFLGIGLSGSTYVLYQYLREVETHSALQAGIIMGVSGVAIVATMWNVPFIVKMLIRFGGRKVVLTALLFQMLSMFLFMQNMTSDTPDRYLWMPLILTGMFSGTMVPGLALAAFMKMDNQAMSNARTLYYCTREFGVSLGVTLTDVLIDRRSALHSGRLLESAYARGVSTHLSAASLSGAVMKQALVLSYADVFAVMGLLAVAACFFVPLLPASPKKIPAPTVSSTALAAGGTK